MIKKSQYMLIAIFILLNNACFKERELFLSNLNGSLESYCYNKKNPTQKIMTIEGVREVRTEVSNKSKKDIGLTQVYDESSDDIQIADLSKIHHFVKVFIEDLHSKINQVKSASPSSYNLENIIHEIREAYEKINHSLNEISDRYRDHQIIKVLEILNIDKESISETNLNAIEIIAMQKLRDLFFEHIKNQIRMVDANDIIISKKNLSVNPWILKNIITLNKVESNQPINQMLELSNLLARKLKEFSITYNEFNVLYNNFNKKHPNQTSPYSLQAQEKIDSICKKYDELTKIYKPFFITYSFRKDLFSNISIRFINFKDLLNKYKEVQVKYKVLMGFPSYGS